MRKNVQGIIQFRQHLNKGTVTSSYVGLSLNCIGYSAYNYGAQIKTRSSRSDFQYTVNTVQGYYFVNCYHFLSARPTY